ncbi:MAG: hypothetical protein HYW86_01470 [Candidatus Roizmanbacteria bacterium]|nr:MAG: hypothetical protein HYW86_01470 [Candidatus Roizmanbacteria bacterium]
MIRAYLATCNYGEYLAYMEKKMDKVTVKIQCKSCSGTGVYRGYQEPKGVAVVCHDCKGTGGVDFSYEPFTGLKRQDGVDIVRISGGAFGAGPQGTTVSYEDFLEGKLPRREEN